MTTLDNFVFRGRGIGWWHDDDRFQCSVIFWQEWIGFMAIVVLGGLAFDIHKIRGPLIWWLSFVLFLKQNQILNQISRLHKIEIKMEMFLLILQYAISFDLLWIYLAVLTSPCDFWYPRGLRLGHIVLEIRLLGKAFDTWKSSYIESDAWFTRPKLIMLGKLHDNYLARRESGDPSSKSFPNRNIPTLWACLASSM